MSAIDYIKELFGGKNFIRFFLATIWSAFAMWFIKYIITHEISGNAHDYVQTILGFLMGTIVAGITGYYFGSSQSSADKDETIKKATQ